MGDQVKPDAEVVTHNALGHVLDHPHVQVRTTYFKDSSRTGGRGPNLHQVSASMLRQLCNDASITVFIENNGVA